MSFSKSVLFTRAICPLLAVFVFASAKELQASGTKFPYQAAVISSEVVVHSGPGSRFYATGKLVKDAKVIVHRHDPGGWYMIAPPKGSFSLVRADYIKKEAAHLGIVMQNHVVVRVASSLNKHREVEQRRLMKGDRVHILGEDKVDERGRVLKMYRIEPPRGEFRWVRGDNLIPLDPTMRKAHDLDPFAVPSNGIEIEAEPKQHTPDLKFPIAGGKHKKTASRTKIPLGKDTGVVESGPSAKDIEHDRKILHALDHNFRNMIEKDIPEWNITDLTHDYNKLKKSTTVPAIASQIELRLNAMQRYRKMKAEYDDLIKLTSATDRKDAELLSMQREVETQVATSDSLIPPSPTLSGVNAFPEPVFEDEHNFLPDLGPAPSPIGSTDIATASQDVIPQSSAFPPDWRSIAQQNGPSTPQPGQHVHQHAQPAGGFSGAGIVQRLRYTDQSAHRVPGPQFVLLSPAGKFLAYLHPGPGVDLNQFLGRSIGVYGPRQKHAALQGDLISVTGLAPVRLTQ